SIIADNFSGHIGGGIVNQAGGKLLVGNSTIARNSSDGAGGIRNDGSLILRNSAIIFYTAAGLCLGGGLVNSRGLVEIANSTIAKNVAATGGGGVWNGSSGQVSITNSTIRENEISGFGSGGGIANVSGTLRVQNTIVAGNTVRAAPFGSGPDCVGTITSLGNNLVGDQSGCDINLQPSDQTGDPELGDLTGTAEEDLPGRAYYPVLVGSVVINRANPDTCPETDQLGNPRFGICDIGAV